MSEIRKKIVGEIKNKLRHGVIMTDSNGSWRRESQIVDVLREIEETDSVSEFEVLTEDDRGSVVMFDGIDFFIMEADGRKIRALDSDESREFLKWVVKKAEDAGVYLW